MYFSLSETTGCVLCGTVVDLFSAGLLRLAGGRGLSQSCDGSLLSDLTPVVCARILRGVGPKLVTSGSGVRAHQSWRLQTSASVSGSKGGGETVGVGLNVKV